MVSVLMSPAAMLKVVDAAVEKAYISVKFPDGNFYTGEKSTQVYGQMSGFPLKPLIYLS